MDLPTCPTCGQSVLDEDASDCPFCGAPLKGGPSKGKPPSKPTPRIVPKNVPAVQAPAPAPAPAAGPKSLPAVTGGKTTIGPDEDPFAVDQSNLAEAIPAQPRKTASKTLEVVCPMCETHGFVPPSAVGKQVRCCNPQCLVPVFTVPAPKVEAPPPPPPPPRPYGKWIVQALTVAAVVGAIVFWWKHRNIEVSVAPVDYVRPSKKDPLDDPLQRPPGTKDGSAIAREKTTAEWQREAFAMIVDLARERNNNRKPTCRRLSATAAVAKDDFTKAREELDQLAKIGEAAPYEAIPPLTQIAWKHWQAGRKPEFEKATADALAVVGKLPAQGRQAAQSAVELAAVLSLSGRVAEAHKLLNVRQQNGEPSNDVAAAIVIALNDGSFDVDQNLPGQAIGGWERPLSTAVTYLLMQRGQTEAARAWAEGDPDQLGRTESVLLWATLIAQKSVMPKNPAGLAQASEAVDKLSPAARVCYQARLAEMLREQKQTAAANEALQSAEKSLAELRVPPAVRLSTVKEFFNWQPPANIAEPQAVARAAAEVALVQAIFGKQAEAVKSLGLATTQLRSLAPSLGSIDALHEKVLGAGPAQARELLREEFNLANEDEERRKVLEFKQKEIGELGLRVAAEQRFRLQQRIVLAAIDHGQLEAATREILARAGAQVTDPNEREPYLSTTLPQLLKQRLIAAQRKDLQQELEGLIINQEPPTEAQVPLVRNRAAQLVEQGQLTEVAALLNPHMVLGDRGPLQLTALRFACRLGRAGKFEPARDYLMALRDESLREDGLRLISAQTSLKKGEARVFDAARQEVRTQAVASSILCGLVEGSAGRPVSPTPDPNVDKKAAEKKPAPKSEKAAGK